MAKLKAPLFALKATGRLGKVFSLAKRRGRHIIERRPIPTDAKSPTQLFSRLMFTKCIDLWHLLSDAERQEWESLARSRHMTGYAWYISQCLRPNPGIYLPLIGGTMTGDIDMATNRILNLPDPTTPQEPDTRFARSTALLAAINAHAGIPAAHHARYTDAEVDAILAVHAALVTGVHGAGDSILATTLNIATHTAIAAAHHTKYTNGEADARIAIHAAIAAAHHARYADAEAVSAMGAKANGNPLHHDRTVKYTDGEAVTAAKTVKLDDFATPDDNTDLNASQTRHGLFKKLDGVVTHFLNGLGNWVAVVSGATISTGTYTGNGGNDRQINTGFKCTLVIVLGVNKQWFAVLNRGEVHYTSSPYHILYSVQENNVLLHATDGFIVDNGSGDANHNGQTFYYWAISE